MDNLCMGCTLTEHEKYMHRDATMELSADDRRFFAAVAEIIFSNPFDDARAEIRDLVPDAPRKSDAAGDHPFAAIVPAVEERLGKLEATGVRRVEDVAERDRDLLSYALLFRVYHHHADRFDSLP